MRRTLDSNRGTFNFSSGCRSSSFPLVPAARPPRKRELKGLSLLIPKARQIRPSGFYIGYLSFASFASSFWSINSRSGQTQSEPVIHFALTFPRDFRRRYMYIVRLHCWHVDRKSSKILAVCDESCRLTFIVFMLFVLNLLFFILFVKFTTNERALQFLHIFLHP